jgi:hypothetical protein
MEQQYPLILVFYLDAELMKNSQIIQPFVDSVNKVLAQKKANAIAFFMPTKGEERIECINPMLVKEPDMTKINALVEDIKKNFSIGEDLPMPDEEIDLGEE